VLAELTTNGSDSVSGSVSAVSIVISWLLGVGTSNDVGSPSSAGLVLQAVTLIRTNIYIKCLNFSIKTTPDEIIEG